MAVSRRRSDEDHYTGSGDLGYYSRTNLNDIINNFIVGYTGEGKTIPKVMRHDVAFHAQRIIQEFNYDIFHSEKALELEIGESNVVYLPSDYVNYKRITYTDRQGNITDLLPNTRTAATQAALQDENYDFIYDENGDIITAQDSETSKRFLDAGKVNQLDSTRVSTLLSNYFYSGGYNANGEDFDSYYSKLYGLTPSDADVNAKFLLDLNKGCIYLSSQVGIDDIITLHYISDGLGDNGDFTDVFVPKLAEEAVYMSLLARLASIMPVAAQFAPLYLKKAKATMNNAKIRLMDLRPTEIKNVLRNKSKWIKH